MTFRLFGQRIPKKILVKLFLKLVVPINNPKAIFFLLNGLAGGMTVIVLNSCSSQPDSVTLSSGTVDGFYNRLGEQIQTSTQTTVGLSVKQINSQGSLQNLERLLAGKVDFAIVQLDVANQAMRERKAQAVAILAHEYVQVIVRKNSGLKTFADLQGKRVAVGSPGSGIRFTATKLIQAENIRIQEDNSIFNEAFKKLISGQVDAVIYVGSVGSSQNLRQQFVENPNLRFLPINTALINHLTVYAPGSYQSATLPIGTYIARPLVPDKPIPTLSTATVLLTRPDVKRRKVALVTWAVLSTARTYSPFYPELQNGDATDLLRRGLFYIHPVAEEVFEQGDPRMALMRYWENNSDLQAGIFILVTTSMIGLLLRQWHRQRSKKMVTTTANRINELKLLLPDHPQQALNGIEDLNQEHRLMFIEGAVTADVYEQLRHKTHTFADQCRTLLAQQRKKFVMDTLLLLDEWQATLQTNPKEALNKLTDIKQQYRDMLLSDQVDIEAYIELMQLTLMSLMTLTPKYFPNGANSNHDNQRVE
ncbi:MAG: TAXI family TRAP transporter solute-binding subunit [Scytonema sp. PMC 1069.18]|nr:TAXI family TRAP transporter solute-binding subunit [Scytonema sp. PMC 1069.18]MEC4885157.1 TAXI family TRAP transporter solute-binding subunit [Scytonema sp. PMC 1070.18]